jgi:hypothetical protein
MKDKTNHCNFLSLNVGYNITLYSLIAEVYDQELSEPSTMCKVLGLTHNTAKKKKKKKGRANH